MIACAALGGVCFGSDLDIRVIHGTGVGRKTKNQIEAVKKYENQKLDIFTNFDHYELPRPDMLVMDNSQSMMRYHECFDAIVTDPPYGVRACSKKTGVKEGKVIKEVPEMNEEEKQPHFPMKETYEYTTVYQDLLINASKLLRVGGRVVFLFHTDQSLPEEKNRFPAHELFEQIAASENPLTKARSRWCITMVKTKPF